MNEPIALPSAGGGTDPLTESPGGWEPPDGVKPGWNWTPPGGLVARRWVMPIRVRIWYRTPLLDRFAYVWMWHHGYWLVHAPQDVPPTDETGVREPRRPVAPTNPGSIEIDP